MPSTAIIWGVIAKIANKMADLSPLFNSLYYEVNVNQFFDQTWTELDKMDQKWSNLIFNLKFYVKYWLYSLENYFQMHQVNILALKLRLKINIWPFMIHFMQLNVSLIKKLIMHIDFIGKNLYPVRRAKLSSISVVILLQNKLVFCYKNRIPW